MKAYLSCGLAVLSQVCTALRLAILSTVNRILSPLWQGVPSIGGFVGGCLLGLRL